MTDHDATGGLGGDGTRRSADGRPLPEKIIEAHRQASQPLTRDDVAAIVSNVIGSMDGDLRASNVKLYSELDAIAQYIKAAKLEIAAIQPVERQMTDIANASDELDAVVQATENATGSILDACEGIEQVVPKIPEGEAREGVVEGVTKIYESCNFQDITGQRISKVVRTLKHLETRIDELLDVFGNAPLPTPQSEPVSEEAELDDHERMKLLNGPALPGSAIDQDAIDKLLADLDN
ncbi:MAG: protein phosphatase CheZ [Alphaproteobacteria bacterium]|nr:protein phosphatase CheZ [Alphaproteobacteria bacterium SS10]